MTATCSLWLLMSLRFSLRSPSEADKATTTVERRRRAKEAARQALAGLDVAAKQKLRADAEARTANPKGKKKATKKAAATRGKGL